MLALHPAAAQQADGFVAPPSPVPQVEPPTPPSVTIEPIVIPTTRPGPPIGSEGLRFVLGGLVIEGATAIPEAELQALWQADLGQEIPLSRVFAVADQIQTLYRNKGYILTRALVPEQRAEGGVFRILVIEGFIETVTIEGDLGDVRDLIAATLDHVRAERPVSVETLERYLLLVNDLPGINATSTLRPATTAQGGSELVVDVTHIPLSGYASVSNRGSRFTGPWGAAASLEGDSLTRFGERFGLLAFSTFSDEQRYVQAFGEGRLNDEGLALAAEMSYGPSQPQLNLRAVDVDSASWYFALRLSDPVIRTRRLSLTLRGALDWTDEDVERTFITTDLQSRDNIRAVRIGADVEVTDHWDGRTVLGLTVARGLPIFQSDDPAPPSRQFGQTDFTKLNAVITRHQTLYDFNDDLSLTGLAKVGGQYALTPLLSSEQFRLGNTLFGRGYAPSEISGDDGLGTTFELQLNGSADWTYAEKTRTIGWQLYGFYDFGVVWSKQQQGLIRLGVPRVGVERQTLAGAGAGLRLYYPEGLSLEVEVAKPLTRQPSEQYQVFGPRGQFTRLEDDPVVYVRLSTVF